MLIFSDFSVLDFATFLLFLNHRSLFTSICLHIRIFHDHKVSHLSFPRSRVQRERRREGPILVLQMDCGTCRLGVQLIPVKTSETELNCCTMDIRTVH